MITKLLRCDHRVVHNVPAKNQSCRFNGLGEELRIAQLKEFRYPSSNSIEQVPSAGEISRSMILTSTFGLHQQTSSIILYYCIIN